MGGDSIGGPRWLDETEQQTWRAFLAVNRLLFERLDQELQRDASMPHAYYEILVRLSEHPARALRMSELATLVGSSRSRLSHAVARLEERGWVRRRACPEDGRGLLATLTDDGYAALVAAAPGHVEAVRTHLFDPLDPSEVEQLRRISQALVRQLQPDARGRLAAEVFGEPDDPKQA